MHVSKTLLSMHVSRNSALYARFKNSALYARFKNSALYARFRKSAREQIGKPAARITWKRVCAGNGGGVNHLVQM